MRSCAPASGNEKGEKLSGLVNQVIVEVEAFEEPLAHIGRDILTYGSMNEVNRAVSCI